MESKKAVHLGILLLLVLAGVGAFFVFAQKAPKPVAVMPVSYSASTLTNEYRNTQYRFSLQMPEDFSAQELPALDTQGSTILLQNKKGAGVQIVISAYGSDLHELTAERIRADIPDLKITDTQTVEIGNDYTGVAFKSDNDAFNGDSRDVWFVFHGTLFQITTYAKDDSLLQAIFGTWKFF